MLRRKYFIAASCACVVAARQIQEDVSRYTDQFQREEERDEFVGRPGQADAGRDEQQAGVVLGRQLVGHLVPARQHQHHGARQASALRNSASRVFDTGLA